MPGFFTVTNPVQGDVGDDYTSLLRVANSVIGYQGDPMVPTDDSGSVLYRPLSASDITDLFQNDANVDVGLTGLARADVATDASGNATTVPSTVALAGNVKPIYALPSLDAGNPPDPTDGRYRAIFETAKNLWGGPLWQNTKVTTALEGTRVGILRSTIDGVVYYFWDSAAGTKIGFISQVFVDDPLFNKTPTANVQNTTHYPRCPVVVHIDAKYVQVENGQVYNT